MFLIMRGTPLLAAPSIDKHLPTQPNVGDAPQPTWTPSKPNNGKRKGVRFEDMGKYIGYIFDYSSLISVVNAGTQPSTSSQPPKVETAASESLSQRELFPLPTP